MEMRKLTKPEFVATIKGIPPGTPFWRICDRLRIYVEITDNWGIEHAWEKYQEWELFEEKGAG